MNDVVQYAYKNKIQLFANDTFLYFVGDYPDFLRIEWYQFKINKAEYTIVKKFNLLPIESNLIIENNNIEIFSKFRYLIIIIDELLSGKVTAKIDFLRRTGTDLSQRSKFLVYKSIIQSYLTHCCSIFYSRNKSEQVG